MRVLVCGGRDYADEERVFATLDEIDREQRIGLIIEGGQRTYEDGKPCRGADLLACRWSYARGRPGRRFDAEWRKYGNAAGPLRNQQMLDEGSPDLVIAFPGGRGTADMVRRAKAAGVKVIEVSA